MKKVLLVLLLFFVIQSAYAKEGHMTLLAVSETNQGYSGSTADLYLEIKPGEGRVFIQTFPLTKLDTQISTRFAKEIACQKLDIDCSSYDFFYTIKSNSAIIGGPSAGAAIAALTIAMLRSWELNESVTVTGTINSGGIIGAVSGLNKKIEAASSAGISNVLIPRGERKVKEGNFSVDLVEYGTALGIEVVEVATLDDVIYEFTGKRVEKAETEFIVEQSYKDVMKGLAVELCNRSKEIAWNMFYVNADRLAIDEYFLNVEEEARNLSDKAAADFKEENYYSAASYCFGANVRYRYLLLLLANYSEKEFEEHAEVIRADITDFEKKLPKYETLTDLQTYAVVQERLIEAQDQLNLSGLYLEVGNKRKATYSLAYAAERLYSAYSWSTFFGKGKTRMIFTKLEEPCLEKLGEAEERFQYLAYAFPDTIVDRAELNRAYADFNNKKYELCLFRASKAKAEADTALIMVGARERSSDVVEAELEAAKKTIAKQTKKGNFPIIGYSYYEYANSLKNHSTYSALLYSEYSLELSNLDMYFEKEKKVSFRVSIKRNAVYGFMTGVAATLITAAIIIKTKKKRKKRKRARKKKEVNS
jgi:uncharacterized protein